MLKCKTVVSDLLMQGIDDRQWIKTAGLGLAGRPIRKKYHPIRARGSAG